ncbi:nucleotidyltransferase domain-containing protein [Georgenia muralis]|uniref:Nucleotidyltransferase-like protein n=1 Tax=Georgenia muralis TaxID=154117 RepID=A0A3N4Z6A4_9MICO|nr:nucleotidyltransferase domain-containing protein [Georgenia muralis]RPF26680.1 nucleotidyltransferase-like protein [Georgenia muralis]
MGEPELDELITGLAARVAGVGGVVGVMLGGSHARDEQLPGSDVDLGLYYRAPLDVAALGAVVREVAGAGATVSRPGEWGPWVDGGAWLRLAGGAVDLIYRDLDRVRRAWSDARGGRYAFHTQAGHPLGVPDFAYAGEVALGVVLADPTGELSALKAELAEYPPALAVALREGLWEASFLVDVAHKAVARRDTTYVAGCLFRAFLLCAHAIHGHAGRWLVNEKGAITAADRLPGAPEGFSARCHGVLAELGTGTETLEQALDTATVVVRDVVKNVHRRSR